MAAPGPWLDAEFLQLKQIPLDAKLSVSSDFEPFDSTTQLVAISNIYDYVVLGRAQGFGFANTADVRNTMSASQKGTVTALDAIVPVDVQDGRVCLLSLSADQKTVVVGTSTGAILLFDAGKLAAGATMPSKKLDVTSSQLKKVSPNPEAYPDTIAVLTMGGEVFFVDSAGTSRRLPVEATAISWSRRGKQLACGTKDGKIVQLNLEGVVKNETPPPEGLVEGAKMGELLWLEDKVFLAVYSDAEEVTSLIYVVSRGGPEKPVSYTLLDDPVPAFLFPEGQLNSYYFEVVRSLGSFQYLGLLARTLSSEVGVIGCEDSGNWASWNLPDGAGASMPLDEEDRETYAVGFGIDYTSTSSLPTAEQDGSPLPPAPIIYILNNQGRLLTFHCINLKAKDATASCPAMVKELKTLKAESSPQKAVIPKKEEPVASTPVKIEFSSASIGKSSDAKTSETVGYTIGQEASKSSAPAPFKLPSFASKDGPVIFKSSIPEAPKPEAPLVFAPPKGSSTEKNSLPAFPSFSFSGGTGSKLFGTDSQASSVPKPTSSLTFAAPATSMKLPEPQVPKFAADQASVLKPPAPVATEYDVKLGNPSLPPDTPPSFKFGSLPTEKIKTEPTASSIGQVGASPQTVQRTAQIDEKPSYDNSAEALLVSSFDQIYKKMTMECHKLSELASKPRGLASADTLLSMNKVVANLNARVSVDEALISDLRLKKDQLNEALVLVKAQKDFCEKLVADLSTPGKSVDQKGGLGPEMKSIQSDLQKKAKALDSTLTSLKHVFSEVRRSLTNERYLKNPEWSTLSVSIDRMTQFSLSVQQKLEQISSTISSLSGSPSKAKASSGRFSIRLDETDSVSVQPTGPISSKRSDKLRLQQSLLQRLPNTLTVNYAVINIVDAQPVSTGLKRKATSAKSTAVAPLTPSKPPPVKSEYPTSVKAEGPSAGTADTSSLSQAGNLKSGNFFSSTHTDGKLMTEPTTKFGGRSFKSTESKPPTPPVGGAGPTVAIPSLFGSAKGQDAVGFSQTSFSFSGSSSPEGPKMTFGKPFPSFSNTAMGAGQTSPSSSPLSFASTAAIPLTTKLPEKPKDSPQPSVLGISNAPAVPTQGLFSSSFGKLPTTSTTSTAASTPPSAPSPAFPPFSVSTAEFGGFNLGKNVKKPSEPSSAKPTESGSPFVIAPSTPEGKVTKSPNPQLRLASVVAVSSSNTQSGAATPLLTPKDDPSPPPSATEAANSKRVFALKDELESSLNELPLPAVGEAPGRIEPNEELPKADATVPDVEDRAIPSSQPTTEKSDGTLVPTSTIMFGGFREPAIGTSTSTTEKAANEEVAAEMPVEKMESPEVSPELGSTNATASTPVPMALSSFSFGTPPKASTSAATFNFTPSPPGFNTSTSTFGTGSQSKPTLSFGQTLQTDSAASPQSAAQTGSPFGQTQGTPSLFGLAASNSPFGVAKSSGAFSGSQPPFGSSLSAGQTSTVTPSGAGQPALVGDSATQKPAFGQSSFGQPSFGQSAFGQTPQKPAPSFASTQPSFGQSSFGQPTFGQPSLGQPAFAQPSLGQPAFGQPSFGQPAFGQPPFGQPAFGQSSFGQGSFGQTAPFAGSGGSPFGAQSNLAAMAQTVRSAQTTFGSSTQFGQGGGFASFGSASGQSPFGQLGQQPAVYKPKNLGANFTQHRG